MRAMGVVNHVFYNEAGYVQRKRIIEKQWEINLEKKNVMNNNGASLKLHLEMNT